MYAHDVVGGQGLIVGMLGRHDTFSLFCFKADVQIFRVDHDVRVGRFVRRASKGKIPLQLNAGRVLPGRVARAFRRSLARFA